MTKNYLRLCCTTTALIILTLLASTSWQSKANAGTELPKGDWTLSILPYLRQGYAERPLVVYSVESKLGTVTNVGVENRSSKTATALKFSWHLSRKQSPDTILQSGQTPLLGLSGIPAGEVKTYNFPVISIGKVSKSLLKNGTLNGNFLIDVAVSEVRYEDGSAWIADNVSRIEK